MKTNWKTQSEKKQREELINFLYEQNQLISNDREKLLVDTVILLANKELYESYLEEIKKSILELQERAENINSSIEQIDTELHKKTQEQENLEEDIMKYYQEVIDSES